MVHKIRRNVHVEKSNRGRFYVAWAIIGVLTVAVTLVIVTNIGVVKMLFGQGSVGLKSKSEVIDYISEHEDVYTNVTVQSSDTGVGEMIQYEAADGGIRIQIQSDGEAVTRVTGTVKLSKLSVSDLKQTADMLVKPFIQSQDVLPLEASLLKEAPSLAAKGVTEDLNISRAYGDLTLEIHSKGGGEVEFVVLSKEKE